MHANSIKLSNLLTPQVFKEQQESLNMEQSQSKLPDYSEDTRFKCNYFPRRKKKVEVQRASLDGTLLSHDKLFVVKADMFDFSQYRFCVLKRNQHSVRQFNTNQPLARQGPLLPEEHDPPRPPVHDGANRALPSPLSRQ